jgi:hypothetical protein
LTLQRQRAAYKKFMDYTSALGVATPLTDYSRFISPEGTTIEVLKEKLGKGAAASIYGRRSHTFDDDDT